MPVIPIFAPCISTPVNALCDANLDALILGRDAQTHRTYEAHGLAFLGTLAERAPSDSPLPGKVYLDIREPHIMLWAGSRGSGKSNGLAVLAEEIAESGLRVGVVLVDPLGVYGALDHANDTPDQASALEALGLAPHGLRNVTVFSAGPNPQQGQERLTVCTADLTVKDWQEFFSIEADSPRLELIRRNLDEVQNGYADTTGKQMRGRRDYDLLDLERNLVASKSINSPTSGFASQTVRSLAQKYASVRDLGIFSRTGTSIRELSVPGRVSVVQLNDPVLDSTAAAKVIGLIARSILRLRVASIRDSFAYIPITWLLIDEAHQFLGNVAVTNVSDDLVKYCKEGRAPGCGLALATQQPSAIRQDVLSQLDMLIVHRLVLQPDIAVLKRITPAMLPAEVTQSEQFVRALPVGTAIVADRMTQNRAIIAQVRPRFTKHQGHTAIPESMESETPHAFDMEGRVPSSPPPSVCHPECSEGSQSYPARESTAEILRSAQNDNPAYLAPDREEHVPQGSQKNIRFSFWLGAAGAFVIGWFAVQVVITGIQSGIRHLQAFQQGGQPAASAAVSSTAPPTMPVVALASVPTGVPSRDEDALTSQRQAEANSTDVDGARSVFKKTISSIRNLNSPSQ
jgi:hypothetical protein